MNIRVVYQFSFFSELNNNKGIHIVCRIFPVNFEIEEMCRTHMLEIFSIHLIDYLEIEKYLA